MSYTAVKQASQESFIDFVDRLEAAINKQIDDENLLNQLLTEFAKIMQMKHVKESLAPFHSSHHLLCC